MAVSRLQMQTLSLGDLPPSEIARLQLLDEQGVSPREDAFQQCLLGIKALLNKHSIAPSKAFISYAWEPEGIECTQLHDFLNRVKKDLTLLGLSVFLDLEKMTGDMKARMRSGIAESDYFLLIGTPLYKGKAVLSPETDNVAFEYALMTQKIAQSPLPQKNMMLVPVWYRGTFREAFPEGVSRSLIRDFKASEDYHKGLIGLSAPLGLVPHLYPVFASDGALHQEYQALVGRFNERLNFLSERQQNLVVQAQSLQQPQLLSALQRNQRMLWNLPISDQQFVGRSDLLARLTDTLSQPSASVAVTACKGLGGVGKTTLVLHYAEHSTSHNLRIWLRAENPLVLAQDILAFAAQLGYGGDQLPEAQAHMQSILSRYPDWLVIFDNVEDYDSIKAFIPRGPGTVLLTSRHAHWPTAFKVLDVDVMPAFEAVALLQSFSPNQNPQDLQTLAQTLGYLPLALAQAGSYLQENELSAQDYLKLYQQDISNAARLLAHLPTGAQVVPVISSWNLTFERLQDSEQGQQAAVLLGFCAHLAPDAIPRSLLASFLKERYPTISKPSLSLNMLLGLLGRYSLLKLQEIQVSIHRILQTVLVHQQPLSPSKYRRWASVLSTEFNRKTQVHEDEARQKALLPHLQTFVAHYQPHWDADKDTILSYATLLSDIGCFFEYQFGKPIDAKAVFERALAIFERHHGPEHLQVAMALSNLGNALGDLGDALGKKALLERALAIFEHHYGPEHLQVAMTLMNLGNALGLVGDALGKKALLERALVIFEHHYGPEHPDVARTLGNLGNVLGDLGDASGQKALLERALAIFERHYGPEHLQVAMILTNLGNAYGALGDASGQKALLERALTIKERHYGPEHVQVAMTLTNLGNAYYSLGDSGQAKALLERVLAIKERYYGPEHPEVAITVISIGFVLKSLGKVSESQPCFRRAHSIFLDSYGAEHAQTQLALKNLEVRNSAFLLLQYESSQVLKGKLIEKYELKNDSESECERGLRKAACNNKVEDLRLFIKLVKNINAKDNKAGKTALHWAAKENSLKCIQALLDGGASPLVEDNDKKTPLDETANPEVLKLLTLKSSRVVSALRDAQIQVSERARFGT